MEATTRFALASEAVASKILDGEAVILHADSGRYHSIAGAGADAWLLLSTGSSIAETTDALVRAYREPPSKVEAEVTDLARDLVAQELLRADPGAQAEGPEIEPDPEGFAPFELVTFSDIEDLLALDPPAPLMADRPWKAEPGE